MRWAARSGALADRITVNKKILQVFNESIEKLKKKKETYDANIEGGKRLQNEFG